MGMVGEIYWIEGTCLMLDLVCEVVSGMKPHVNRQ